MGKVVQNNLHYGKKTVVVVNVDANKMAKAIVKDMKENGFEKVIEMDAVKSYANYNALKEFDPDYTIFVDESNSCKVLNVNIDSDLHKRDSTNATNAREFYRHHLMMLGIKPQLLGSRKIPYEDVRYIDWYFTNKSPILSVELPNRDGVAHAVTLAVQDYFRASNKAHEKEQRENDRACKTCTGLRGSVKR